jgi:hypothetical protein
VILKVPEHCQCQVFDANGVELKYAIWADTETGEAEHYVRDETGFVIVHPGGYIGESYVKTEKRQHPAPLRFVPMVDPPPAPVSRPPETRQSLRR